MKSSRSLHRPRGQQGVVLLVALAMLVVIGFLSTAIMRNALFGDIIASNIRSSEAAKFGAEVALKQCEARLLQPLPTPTAPHFPAPATGDSVSWRTDANWNNPLVIMVNPDLLQPAANKNSGGVTFRFTPQSMPRCMIERVILRSVGGGSNKAKIDAPSITFQITARGFSPDYRPDAAGGATGAEVLLQSTIRIFCNQQSPFLAECA